MRLSTLYHTRHLLTLLTVTLVLSATAFPLPSPPISTSPTTTLTLKNGRQIVFEPLGPESVPFPELKSPSRGLQSFEQLKERVECLRGCLELFAPRCGAEELDCLCHHLQSPSLSHLVNCAATACRTPPPPLSPLYRTSHHNDEREDDLLTTTQTSTDTSRWGTHLGLARLLADYGLECKKAGSFGTRPTLEEVLALTTTSSSIRKDAGKGDVGEDVDRGKQGSKPRSGEIEGESAGEIVKDAGKRIKRAQGVNKEGYHEPEDGYNPFPTSTGTTTSAAAATGVDGSESDDGGGTILDVTPTSASASRIVPWGLITIGIITLIATKFVPESWQHIFIAVGVCCTALGTLWLYVRRFCENVRAAGSWKGGWWQEKKAGEKSRPPMPKRRRKGDV